MSKKVNIRALATPSKDCVAFFVQSEKQEELTNQDILDAVSEYLLVFREYTDDEEENKENDQSLDS